MTSYVVTPYYRESIDMLDRCHRSVLAQTREAIHVMVSDGEPITEIDSWDVAHIKLPLAHRDYGDCARLVGAIHSISEGATGIAFLDADNTFRNDHVETLERCHSESEADFIISGRYLCRIDGSPMGECPRSRDGVFADTNTMYFTPRSFPALCSSVLAGRAFSPIGDRVIFSEIKRRGYSIAATGLPTVNYTCTYGPIYTYFNETPPPDAHDDIADILEALKSWKSKTGESL